MRTTIGVDELKAAWTDLCTHCVRRSDRNYLLLLFDHYLRTHLSIPDAWPTEEDFMAWFTASGAVTKRSWPPLQKWRWPLRKRAALHA